VDFEMSLDPATIENLIGMGPSAHHHATAADDGTQDSGTLEIPGSRTVTASVTVQTFTLLPGI
jgi:23S rRNA (guanine745-N1)-methyltransferase